MTTVLLVLVGVYALLVLALVVFGRRERVRAVAGFVPDCLVLLRRLWSDPSLPRRLRWLIGFGVGYLVFPIDLVPDVIPVAGQLDDAVVAALVLRAVVRGAGADAVRRHWPGPPSSLAAVLRLA